MVGSGQANVHTVVSIAQSQLLDGEPTPAIRAFASLGGYGANPSKEERDMHRWLTNLYNIQLEVYYVDFTLQVICLQRIVHCFSV